MIKVRAKEGRAAFTLPRGGKPIPSDRDLIVQDSPWLRDLANKHGDITIADLADEAADAASPKPAVAPAAKTSK